LFADVIAALFADVITALFADVIAALFVSPCAGLSVHRPRGGVTAVQPLHHFNAGHGLNVLLNIQ
jgi:hypothetical protein